MENVKNNARISFSTLKNWANNNPIMVFVIALVIVVSSAITLIEGGVNAFDFYKKTFLHKRDIESRIGSLSVETNINYFTDTLGLHPAFKNAHSQHYEYIYVHSLFYVHAVTDRDQRVLMFSVTTRDHRFNPSFDLGKTSTTGKRFRFALGQNRFSEIEYSPQEIFGSAGARRFSYYEKYYFGNPGFYQNYIISFNDAGIGNPGPLGAMGLEFDTGYNNVTGTGSADLDRFRRETVINTYTVIAPFSNVEREFSQFGPDHDQVRVLR